MDLVKAFFELGSFDVNIKQKELYSFPSSPTHLGAGNLLSLQSFLHHVLSD